MRNPSTLRRALLLGAAALAALALTACGDTGMNHGSTPTVSAPAAGGTFNAADVRFAQQMIPHHQQAVAMSTLAETRASDPELKAMAAQIKGAQDPEITTMTGWLTGWKQPTMMPGTHDMPGMSPQMPGMLSADELATLATASGIEFDRLYARGMIAHHHGAITMAGDEQATGGNAEAKALAVAIVKAQKAEVEKLQKILDRL